jgi:glycosyltransferase involved in cell wall biosynthesis
LAVSRDVLSSIERLGLRQKTRVEVVLNAISVDQVREESRNLNDLRLQLGIGPENLVVGTVAVFSRQKRLEDWLKVAVRIASEREDVTFLLAGDGPEAPRLRAQVQDLGLGDRVRLPGFRPDGRRALGVVDVYLMTSEYEGLPLAMLEAMALGKPVVATAVGGIPEVVQEGQEGFLAPVGAVDRLAQQAIRLLDDPQLRLEMGQRGARKIQAEYDIKQRVCFMEDLYLELLGGGAAKQLATDK